MNNGCPGHLSASFRFFPDEVVWDLFVKEIAHGVYEDEEAGAWLHCPRLQMPFDMYFRIAATVRSISAIEL